MPRSPWTTGTPGRRGAFIGASAAVVCLGGVLAGCAGGSGGGYTATGAAGGPPRAPGTAAPTGGVRLVPLDGTPSASSQPPWPERGAGNSPGGSGTSRSVQEPGPSSGPDLGPSTGPGAPSADGAESGRTTADPQDSPTPAAGPAVLVVGDPVRRATDERRCEDVTLGFHNTGGSAVRSGTVTFGTHVIGALGVDWATVESTEELPAPIGAGAREEKTWTVCVDAWRVPLGMRIETRDVSVRWR
ncbi:hypothetical protein [Streptomyces sp. YU58]|uniref:hypothetical protein n=1 Tax=Streptomyces sp. SX92 TaxID=3158972 RepID=UPI0027B9B773|nr:hypothetical protein [Streptomyces coralus]WLW53816.1 hypothetical protein QU709_21695 [Streptomyces coralus]